MTLQSGTIKFPLVIQPHGQSELHGLGLEVLHQLLSQLLDVQQVTQVAFPDINYGTCQLNKPGSILDSYPGLLAPAFVLQVTNAGARRPGYEARSPAYCAATWSFSEYPGQ